MTVIEQLKEFIATDGIRNKWLEDDQMKVYVRRSMRYFPEDRKARVCLDVASVDVAEPMKGTFTAFLSEAHLLNPWHATYVENVLIPELASSLVRQGYLPLGDSFTPCFYQLTESGHESVRHARASEYETR